MIGMIIPPGEIKKVVEKTALHVAKNGSQFEKALIEMEQHKPQFSFLLKENPYRPFYDHMVAEYSRKLMGENDEEIKNQVEHAKIEEKEEEVEPVNEQKQFLQRIFEEVKEPDPDRFTTQIPEKLSKGDIAMIQHTAQYAAINGKNFLIALSERQKNNPQYQFLRSSSENHQYFNKLVEGYKNILSFSQTDINLLNQYASDRSFILKKCREVYEYHKMRQEQTKGKKQNEQKKKQSNVDWNDFQLVQTIMFDDFKPRTYQEEKSNFTKPLYVNKNLEEKIISEPKKKQLLQQCHVCKKNIPASEMTRHLKTCLGVKKNDQQPSGKGIQNIGDEVDIRGNLENLSKKRPDIFGGKGENLRKQENNQDQEEKLIWDGQAPNMSRATASVAMVSNEQKKIKHQLKDPKK